MAPPPPLELIDDVAAEIFLRLPPDEPEHLVRASLVCKSWFRLVTDPDFLRRYRAFHRTPPLLGYLGGLRWIIPTTAVPLAPHPNFRCALDCHHGRVLLQADDWHLVVWDPVTGDWKVVRKPGMIYLLNTAAVFCSVSGCDHLDCHGGPFQVFVIGTDELDQVKAILYSSETGSWSTPVTLGYDCEIYVQRGVDGEFERSDYKLSVSAKRCAVIGDEIYFTVQDQYDNNVIVKYNLGKNCLSMVDLVSEGDEIALLEMEDGSLGVVYCLDSSLYLWSINVSSGVAAEWGPCRVIDLGKFIPLADSSDNEDSDDYDTYVVGAAEGVVDVVGAAEGVGIIFVSSNVGLFTVKLSSGQVKKVDEPGDYFSILPYMSFYTPDWQNHRSQG